jgi:hypothetical protein
MVTKNTINPSDTKSSTAAQPTTSAAPSTATPSTPALPASSDATATTVALAATAPAVLSAAAISAAMPALITATANGSLGHSTKVNLQAQYQALIFGLYTYYDSTDVFRLPTGDLTRDELIVDLQKFVAACQNTNASYQQWRANIQTERAMETDAQQIRTGIKGIVQARFGAAGAQNLQFGFSLPKPREKSAETKAAAVVKSLATRKKRNTMGSVQKQKVKSNVDVALVVSGEDSGQVNGAAGTSSGAGASGAAPVPAAGVSNGGATAVAPAATAGVTVPSVTNGH